MWRRQDKPTKRQTLHARAHLHPLKYEVFSLLTTLTRPHGRRPLFRDSLFKLHSCFLLYTGGNKDNRQDPAEPKQPSEGNALLLRLMLRPISFINPPGTADNCADRKQSMLGRRSCSSIPQTGQPCLLFLLGFCNTPARFGHLVQSLPHLQFWGVALLFLCFLLKCKFGRWRVKSGFTVAVIPAWSRRLAAEAFVICVLALSLLCNGFWEAQRRLSTRLLRLVRGAFAPVAAGGDGVLGLPPVLSRRPVLFHQFFQSSIDSGFCILEARALCCWLWQWAQKNTESWQQRPRKHKAWGFCPQAVLFLPSCLVTIRGRLWGICQAVFPVPHSPFTFSFNAYLKYLACTEIQTLWVTDTWRVSSGLRILLEETLTWVQFVAANSRERINLLPLPSPAAEYWPLYWSFYLVRQDIPFMTLGLITNK